MGLSIISSSNGQSNMSIFRLYGRVLALLGSESRLAWSLALANMALASAQFAEPVLLGRIIDTLTGAQTRGEPPSLPHLGGLLAAWAGFGLFTIACGTLIALYADRLAHRRRHVVLTGYFEHVLQLPLTYHGNTHSGRLMKVMLQGTDALWRPSSRCWCYCRSRCSSIGGSRCC
jgi:ABC-type multidrug transport system fused ATPase/permease subunit